MKRFILSIILFLGFISATWSRGGHLEYAITKDSLLVVKTFMIRDCRGTALNSNSITLFYQIGNATSFNKCGSGNKKVGVRKKITDITFLCQGAKAPCSPQNTYGTGNGFELHEFWDTFSLKQGPFKVLLDSSSCQEVKFIAAICCRNSGITNHSTAGTEMHIPLTIYFGNLRKTLSWMNQSPKYPLNIPSKFDYFVTQEVPLSASDEEGDVLRYSFDKCYNSATAQVNYTTGTLQPFPANCNGSSAACNANPNLQLPNGVFLDSNSGRMVFYSQNVQQTVNFAVTVREYKADTNGNLVLVSRQLKEYYWFIGDQQSANLSPEIKSLDAYDAFVGDTLVAEFNVNDRFSGSITKTDTIDVQYTSSDTRIQVTVLNPKSKNKKVQIKFVPTAADFKNERLFVNLYATDRYCPNLTGAFKRISIKVKKKAQVGVTVSENHCESLNLKATVDTSLIKGNLSLQWLVQDSATKVVYKYNSNPLNSPQLPKGKKYLQLVLSHPDYSFPEWKDTFVFAKAAEIKYYKSSNLCSGDSLTLGINSKNMKGLAMVKYTLKGETIQHPQKFKPQDSAFRMYFEALDSSGCTARDSQDFTVVPLPQPKFKEALSVCGNQAEIKLTDLPIDGSYQYQFTCSAPNTIQNSVFKFNDVFLDGKSFPIIRVKTTDTFQCSAVDSFQLKVYDHPKFSSVSKEICQNETYISLDELINGKLHPIIHEFQIIEIPAGNPSPPSQGWLVKNSQGTLLNVGPKREEQFAGRYRILVSANAQTSQCNYTDTLSITVVNEPKFQFTEGFFLCQNQPYDLLKEVKLDGKSAQNGIFRLTRFDNQVNPVVLGTQLIDQRIMPKTARAGLWEAQYIGPSNGCSDTSDVSFRIFQTPESRFNMNNDSVLTTESPKIDIINNSSIEENSTLTFLWNPGTGNPADNSTDRNFQFTYPAISAEYLISLISSSIMGCNDTAIQRIRVVEQNGLEDFMKQSPYAYYKLSFYNTSGQLVDQQTIDKETIWHTKVPGLYIAVVEGSHDGQNFEIQFKGKVVIQPQ
jgi:hypothetical protein